MTEGRRERRGWEKGGRKRGKGREEREGRGGGREGRNERRGRQEGGGMRGEMGETRDMGRRNLLQMYISMHDQPLRLTSPAW